MTFITLRYYLFLSADTEIVSEQVHYIIDFPKSKKDYQKINKTFAAAPCIFFQDMVS